MMTKRQKQIEHIKEMELAYNKTRSVKAKRDLQKGIHRAIKQLQLYDRLYYGK